MEVNGFLYAVCLARQGTKNRNDTVVKVLQKVVSGNFSSHRNRICFVILLLF